jgi:hypothetical protein
METPISIPLERRIPLCQGFVQQLCFYAQCESARLTGVDLTDGWLGFTYVLPDGTTHRIPLNAQLLSWDGTKADEEPTA